MNQIPIDQLIQTCLAMLKELDFKETTIQRHRRHFRLLRDFMRTMGQLLYDESIGELYQLDKLTEGRSSEFSLKEIRHSINLLNDMVNDIPVRKKRTYLNTYLFPGEFGPHIQAFMEYFKVECRPACHTLNRYKTSLSHFSVRMQQDGVYPNNLDKSAVNRFVSSLQNTQLHVSVPVRRFLRYLYNQNLTEEDLSIPLFDIKCHRAEKLPSMYSTDEIRRMGASVEKSSATGRRNYAIFLLASQLGLRASDICLMQFHNIDWERNIIQLTQQKTQRKIELPLLNIVGEAIIDYIRNARPKSRIKTIFLTAQAPFTTISTPGLSSIISHVIFKAGVDTKSRHHGAHCLRHSLATRLLEQGSSLPIISDALGHSDTQSTMVYLNVDIKGLLSCSLDVPPVPDIFYMQKGGGFYE